MRCKEVKKRLHAYLDNEIDGSQKARIQEHLGHCSNCAKETHLLSRTSHALKVWRDVEPSDDFGATFWRKVDAQEAIQPLHTGLLTRLTHIPYELRQ